jgi:hypothetical protein
MGRAGRARRRHVGPPLEDHIDSDMECFPCSETDIFRDLLRVSGSCFDVYAVL